MPALGQATIRSAVLSLFVLGITSTVGADVITFATRDAFRTAIAVGPSLTEGWDTFPSGTVIANGTTVNGIGYHLEDLTAEFIVTAGGATVSPPNGLGRTGNPFGSEAFLPGDVITLTTPTPMYAVGLSINTFAMSPGAYTLTISRGDVAASVFDPFPGVPTGQFVGLISSELFSSVTIRSTVDFQFGLDDLIAAPPVPVPEAGTLMLLGCGVLVLSGSRLRSLLGGA